MTGELGESLANVFLSRRTAHGHLFRTAVIGGKWPTIDIYAELITSLPQNIFCFFQIKTTEQGYTRREGRLKVGMTLQDLVRLSLYQAPTYVLGIDYNAEHPFESKGYIGIIRGNYTRRLGSLPVTYPLTANNLIALHGEIIAYWKQVNSAVTKANYLTNFTI